MDVPVVLQPQPKRFQLPKQIKRHMLVGLLLTAVISFCSIYLYSTSQPELPLFYSLALAEDQVVQNEWIFVLPVIAIILFLGHLILLNVLSKLDEEMMKLFTWITIFLLSLIVFIFVRLFIVL